MHLDLRLPAFYQVHIASSHRSAFPLVLQFLGFCHQMLRLTDGATVPLVLSNEWNDGQVVTMNGEEEALGVELWLLPLVVWGFPCLGL